MRTRELLRRADVLKDWLDSAPVLVFCALAAVGFFQPWIDGSSAREGFGLADVGLVTGWQCWQGWVVLAAVMLVAAAELRGQLAPSHSRDRQTAAALSLVVVAVLMQFRLSHLGWQGLPFSGDARAPTGGTGWNLAFTSTLALLGTIAWQATAHEVRTARRPDTWRQLARRPAPVAFIAMLLFIASTQAWTIHAFDSQRGIHLHAGILTAGAAAALLIATWLRPLRLVDDRLYFAASCTAAFTAFVAAVWVRVGMVGRHDPEVDAFFNPVGSIRAGHALDLAVIAAAGALVLLAYQVRASVKEERWARMRSRGLHWPVAGRRAAERA